MCDNCTSLLLLILNILPSLPGVLAQVTFAVPSTSTLTSSTTMPPTANLASLANFASSSLPPPSIPEILSQPPLQTLPELFNSAVQPQQEAQVKSRVFNYYFLFLALLAAALAVLLWWMHRQRRREQEQIRLGGQRALVRDVERWAFYRRNQPTIIEGLNESGEAPPPYKPTDNTLTSPKNGIHDPELFVQVARPPRALSRGEIEGIQLPDYLETDNTHNSNRSTASEMITAQAAISSTGDITS